MKIIKVSLNRRAFIEDADFELINQFKWHIRDNKNTFYAATTLKKKEILMHRLIMNAPKGLVVDHIDGNGLNNQRDNLRVVTTHQNNRNQHTLKTSKYPGVYWDKKSKKWTVSINLKYKKIIHKQYANEKEAGGIAYSIYKLIDSGVIK